VQNDSWNAGQNWVWNVVASCAREGWPISIIIISPNCTENPIFGLWLRRWPTPQHLYTSIYLFLSSSQL